LLYIRQEEAYFDHSSHHSHHLLNNQHPTTTSFIMGILDKVQDKLAGNKHHDNTTSTGPGVGSHTHNQGMVPGSQAHNPNAIPTAGGQTVGGNDYNNNNNFNNNPNVGGPGYGNAGVHQTAGDKMQNALPGQHGNAHDAQGRPVDLSGPGHNTHNTHAGGFSGSNTHNTHNTHGSGGLTGSNTHNNNNAYGGPDNRGMMDKAKDTLSSNRSNQPDDPVTGTNYDQTNRNTHGGGMTGSNGPYNQSGSGLAGHNTHNTHNTHGSGIAGSNTHNTHGHNAGPDNRGMMDKAKDALSSKRSNHPDDPVTGTNYDQNNHNTHGGITGSNDPYSQTGSGLHGNTHNTHNTHGSGIAGSNTHATHGTHDTHGHAGQDNRGLMDKAKDVLSSKRSNHPDDPVTGTNYDQKNTSGVHQQHGVVGGNNYNQQPGVGQPGVGQPGVGQPGVGQPGVGHTGNNPYSSGPANY
jgi:hypothetical protein